MSQKSDCCKVIIFKTDNNPINPATVEYVTNVLKDESTTDGYSNVANGVPLNNVGNEFTSCSNSGSKNRHVRNCKTNLSEKTPCNIKNDSRKKSTQNSNDYYVAVINRINDLDKDLKSDRKTASKRHKTILQSIGIIFFILVGFIITAIAYALLASRQF